MSAKVYVVVPPYSEISDPSRPEDVRGLRPGSIAFLDQAEASIGDLALQANRLVRANPAACLLVGLNKSDPAPADALEALRSAGQGALLGGGPPELPMLLRAARQASRSVASQLIVRLRLLGRDVSTFLETAIAALSGRTGIPNADDWASRLHISTRTLRRRLQEGGAPPPHHWLELDHTIRTVLILQKDRRTPVPEALDEARFTSPKAGRGTFKKLAGMPARQARSLIGWYWIVERWIDLYWSREGRGAALGA